MLCGTSAFQGFLTSAFIGPFQKIGSRRCQYPRRVLEVQGAQAVMRRFFQRHKDTLTTRFSPSGSRALFRAHLVLQGLINLKAFQKDTIIISEVVFRQFSIIIRIKGLFSRFFWVFWIFKDFLGSFQQPGYRSAVKGPLEGSSESRYFRGSKVPFLLSKKGNYTLDLLSQPLGLPRQF